MPDHPYGLLASGAQAFRIEAKLNAVMAQLGIVIKDESLVLQLETKIMATEDDNKLLADQILAGVTTLVETVNSETMKINDLQAQLAAANGDQAKIDAVNAELTTIVGNLSAAAAAAPAANPQPPADPNAPAA